MRTWFGTVELLYFYLHFLKHTHTHRGQRKALRASTRTVERVCLIFVASDHYTNILILLEVFVISIIDPPLGRINASGIERLG